VGRPAGHSTTSSGIEEVVELELQEDELGEFKNSAVRAVRELVEVLHG